MTKALIITEKPSVARDLVAALGGFTAHGQDYWESQAFVVTFAVGHLLELCEPEEYDPAHKRWRFEDLPLLPKVFKLKPKKEAAKRLRIIKDLLARRDVTRVVNACDAAREGELIFREIVEFLRSTKPIERIWLQSLLPEAIRAAVSARRPGEDFAGLAAAAACRSRSDWIIGMNATRALTLRLRQNFNDGVWSAGRVQTPTLAILVDRELEILAHVPKEFFRVKAGFVGPSGQYEGYWFDPKFKRDEKFPERKDDRIFAAEQAHEIAARTKGKAGLASETRKLRAQRAPLLFNLTGLQKAMSQRFGWTAKRTLDAAQRCYETHKVLTYPRTESTCLPADYRDKVDGLIRGLADDARYKRSAVALRDGKLENEERVFDPKGVGDHFAIIPTGYFKARLEGDDEKLFDAVVRRFLAAFFPPAQYAKVERISQVGDDHFRTGPVETLQEPGWLSVYERKAKEGEAHEKLPPLIAGKDQAQGVAVTLMNAQLESDATKPPPRLTESGILGLMEHAGRYIEDQELASALSRAEGLGTAATRAEIIENLKLKGYVAPSLRPMPKGITLIITLRRLNAARLTSPELTGRLEFKLHQVEGSTESADGFMTEIANYVSDVVQVTKDNDLSVVFPDQEPLGRCPGCMRSQVYEKMMEYRCAENCGWLLPKGFYGRYIDRAAAATLVQLGRTHRLEGFLDAAGAEFAGKLEIQGRTVIIHPEGAVKLGQAVEPLPPKKTSGVNRSHKGATGHGDYSGFVLGPCPVHKGEGRSLCQVIEATNCFLCETRKNDLREGKQDIKGFVLPKRLCSRSMSLEDAGALLETGQTPILDGFISKQGRPFRAFLTLREDGGVQLEFPPRSS